MTKLCKDCKWFKRDWIFWEFHQCVAPFSGRFKTSSLVVGNPKVRKTSCIVNRSEPDGLKGYCGPRGDWWEPKQ